MAFDIGSMLSSFGNTGGFDANAMNAPESPAPQENWLNQGQNTEMLSYVLDQLGSKIAPNNPAAGIGTHLAQGSVASQAVQGEQNKMAEFIKGVLAQLSGKDQPGPTDVKVTMGDDGAPKFSITGIGPAETRTPEQVAPGPGAPQPAQASPAQDLLKQFGYTQ